MIALCVDDERLLLEDLKRAVGKSPDISQVVAFDDAIEADEWAQEHDFDIAFLDVRMPLVDGLELAKRLHRKDPYLPIVFCTGFREYALDAFAVHASGYLLKPVRAEKLQQEINIAKEQIEGHKAAMRAAAAETKEGYLLTIQPYDGFTVLDQSGTPLSFKRSKEKELFAALVHQRGKEISTDSLCDMLWEDNAWMYEKNRQYIYTLFSLLRNTLREAGAESVLGKGASGYVLDMRRIFVDESKKDTQKYLPGYRWSGEKHSLSEV